MLYHTTIIQCTYYLKSKHLEKSDAKRRIVYPSNIRHNYMKRFVDVIAFASKYLVNFYMTFQAKNQKSMMTTINNILFHIIWNDFTVKAFTSKYMNVWAKIKKIQDGHHKIRNIKKIKTYVEKHELT